MLNHFAQRVHVTFLHGGGVAERGKRGKRRRGSQVVSNSCDHLENMIWYPCLRVPDLGRGGWSWKNLLQRTDPEPKRE
jgi:hypothetical protein